MLSLLALLGVSEAAGYPSKCGGRPGSAHRSEVTGEPPGLQRPCQGLGGAGRKAHSGPKQAAFAFPALTVQRVGFLVPASKVGLAGWSQAAMIQN